MVRSEPGKQRVPVLDVAEYAEIDQHDRQQHEPLLVLEARLDGLLLLAVGRILARFVALGNRDKIIKFFGT